MPELSNNFLKGRMNKDLDDRIVPRGEYRDALNIEVSTTENADIGTVQNLKGNKQIVSGIFNSIHDSNIYTTEGAGVYSSLYTDQYGTANNNESTSSNVFNEIIYNPSIIPLTSTTNIGHRSTILEIGKSYTVTFDVEVNINNYNTDGEYTYTAGIVGSEDSDNFTSTINVQNNVLIANADSSTGVLFTNFTKTFFAQNEYIQIYASKSFSGLIKNITVVESNVLVSDSSNAITVGSKEDTTTDTIYNFVYKASDVKSSTFSNSQGIVKSVNVGIVSDCIISHKPNTSTEDSVDEVVFTDVYKVVLAPIKSSTGKLPMSTSDGIPTSTTITGLPYIVNEEGITEIQGIRLGMDIAYINTSGIDFWAGKGVKVTNIYFDTNTSTGAITITNPHSVNLYNNNAVEEGHTLEFTSNRILNFTCGTIEKELNVDNTPSSNSPIGTNIHAINIVEDFIYFTDGRNEPKKIDIKRFTESTRSIFHHTFLTEINTSDPVKFAVEEKHVTVIKAKPTSHPYLLMNGKFRNKTGYIKISGNIYNGKGDFPAAFYAVETSCLVQSDSFEPITFLKDDDNIKSFNTEIGIGVSINNINWKEGDNIILTGLTSTKKVNIRIVNALPNSLQFNKFTVKVISFDSSYEHNNFQAESWTAELEAPKAIYERNFVSFATRYKYDNNEYSAIGPYSEAAFLPSAYSYKAETGFNASMENTLRSLEIFDFVPSDIQKDVKAVDIILKDHFSTNAYVIKTVEKDTPEWNTIGHGANQGRYEINSEVKGTTVPSLQLSRVFDAVPVKAKTQEFIASRLMYGNYTESYNMVDHGQSSIDFSMISDFENIDGYTVDLGTGSSPNDLFASCNPFFDVTTESHKYIHNYFKQQHQLTPEASNNYDDTDTSSSQAIFCAEDIDTFYNGGTVGNGPRYAKVLIPIIPKDEDNDDNVTHLFPSLNDLASSSNDEGASGNYQDFNCTHDDTYNTGVNEPGNNELSSSITPFIYKLPSDGEYTINVSTRANARYFYGKDLHTLWAASGAPNSHTAQWSPGPTQLSKAMPSRLEVHKVDIAGNSLGIIKDSENLLNTNTPFATTKYSTYAASELLTEEPLNGKQYRLTQGSKPLHNHRNTNSGDSPNIPYHQLRRKITVGTGSSLSANDYIGIFYVYQVSFLPTTNTPVYTPPFVDYNIALGQSYASFTPNHAENANIRFLIDSTTTVYNIDAPLTTNSVEVYKPAKSVKSNRSYETGVTYLDEYGRESTVMISETASLEINEKFSDKKNIITSCIKSNAPKWATHYKYYIKESGQKTPNIVMYKAYSNEESGDSSYAWLSFNSNDFSKVNVDDYLLAKKMHGNNKAVNNILARYRVLDVSAQVPSFVTDDGETTPLQVTASDASGKFFVKVERLGLIHIINESTDDAFFAFAADDANTAIGAVFEIESESASNEGFFWETSKAYPIILNNKTIHQYITAGDKIEMDSLYDPATGLYLKSEEIHIWNQNNTSVKVLDANGAVSFPNVINTLDDNQLCTIVLNKSVGLVSSNLNGNYIIAKFVKEDGSYVTARVANIDNNSITIIPYTHPVSKVAQGALNKIALPWFNCFTWFNGVESDTIGDIFNGKTLYPYISGGKQSGFNASDYFADYGEENNKHDIIYSQLLNESSNIDMTNQFILADSIIKKLNSSHGQINSIISRNNDLLVFCEDKVLKILSSGKDALFNADGNPQLIASNRVLGQSMPFVGDFGCQHPESIAVDEYRVYFIDKARGCALRLSRNGITQISNEGMSTWFNENLEKAQSVVGSFDDKKSEYNITVHDITSSLVDKNVYTLSFDESANGWVSFKSFIQENGLSLNNRYYTFKKGRIYLHHSDDALRNNFYGVQGNSTVTSLINMQPNIVKSFAVINYEGSQAEVVKSLTDDRHDNIQAKSGWSVELLKTDQQEGLVEEFIEKEGRWYNNIKGKKE